MVGYTHCLGYFCHDIRSAFKLVVDWCPHSFYTLCAFWVIQFAGVTQLEQSKMLFDKLSYEIDSRQILIKLNSKQGMPMKWDQVKRAWADKKQFVLVINKAQMMMFPYTVFKTQNEVKFIETILKRKGLIKE